MSSYAAAILERAIHHARAGERNPHRALIRAGDGITDIKVPIDPAEIEAYLAVIAAARPGTLVEWTETVKPTCEQTAALLEEALFQVQLAG